jgi:flap endonuclease-1
MGIQGLTKLIADNAPQALKDEDIKNFFGRTVAVDASMTLYQFIIAVRPDDLGQYTLTNDQGEATRFFSLAFDLSDSLYPYPLKSIFLI